MTDQQLEVRLVHAATAGTPGPSVGVEHAIRLVERGPFVVAQCTGCGWETFARRSRPLARREGQDHVVLHRASGAPMAGDGAGTPG
jgi:hypothetical protein